MPSGDERAVVVVQSGIPVVPSEQGSGVHNSPHPIERVREGKDGWMINEVTVVVVALTVMHL